MGSNSKTKSHQILNPELTPTLAGDLKIEFIENWIAESQNPKTNLFRVTKWSSQRQPASVTNC